MWSDDIIKSLNQDSALYKSLQNRINVASSGYDYDALNTIVTFPENRNSVVSSVQVQNVQIRLLDDNVAERFQCLHKLIDTRALKRLKPDDAKSLILAYNQWHDDDNLFIGGPLTRSFEALIYWVN